MSRFLTSVICAVLLSSFTSAAPASTPVSSVVSSSVATPSVVSSAIAAPSSVASAVSPIISVIGGSGASTASAAAATPTVAYASDRANGMMWNPDTTADVQPIRGSLGATILGPQNIPIGQQNPDLLAPPTTDAGTVGQAKWPMSLSANRLQTGGWARQQNSDVMPMATGMAGVNMRLEAGAVRELHWHKTAEWAYIISGYTQITSVNSDGQNFLATLGPGDLWYFPPGVPHSLQGTNQTAAGTEFLLVFPDGDFSEDSTFLLTDWTAHIPKEVLAKNFQTTMSSFDEIPGSELYIFPMDSPSDNATAVEDPAGQVPQSYAYSFSQIAPTPLSGGSIKIADSTKFPIATQVAVAEVVVEPGAMRELHWHPTQDEWGYFLEGQGRMTLFASSGNARTYNYEAGDVSYIPATYGHYVENTGNTTLKFLEIWNTAVFQDISLSQWLALTPPALVQAHLQLSNEIIAGLNKTKQFVVGPANSSQTSN
ncbi:hypothetical protein EW026_g3469 [Hermanssonia centrifuga]|uniref:Cupin type-1 domain-containing protein n=1 Tax=Hermanssonia centrifuga TaxID=98765 RepID=A0A4V3XAN1_9APHY|nr:hypothetical protein EW026_g3469 [Hermanssonia centrifuga]